MTGNVQPTVRRIAIVGCGSSGLICLKTAVDTLLEVNSQTEDRAESKASFEVVCFEKSNSIVGCWGDPYPGFVSTSTRFTTQFASFPICDASVRDDGGASREEFFRNREYGDYLESFADHFKLRPYIRLKHDVQRISRSNRRGWELVVCDDSGATATEHFDVVIVCTGLAARPRELDCDAPCLTAAQLNGPDGCSHIRGKTIVVTGGGESAVDYANRLADPNLNNSVFLSLRSGVRVSPRYHPVRGVPSDFLRNRLMLSIHPDLRNSIGQVFVELRIKYQDWFERIFPSQTGKVDRSSKADRSSKDKDSAAIRADWAMRLTKAAKNELFNMFHNKSDDFLDAVAEGRIRIVGPAHDSSHTRFQPFDETAEAESLHQSPDFVVPSIGYQSTLGQLFKDPLLVSDFFLGCCHEEFDDLFLVGFARPVIGNIPTISEMQAHYVFQLISGEAVRPPGLGNQLEEELEAIRERFGNTSVDAVYPVEMFPYCDRLAKLSGLSIGQAFWKSPANWWRMMLSPATTMHYFQMACGSKSPIYMPPLLVLILLFLKPIDWIYRRLGKP